MHLKYIKQLTVYTLFSISFISFAQKDFQGKAYYETKVTLDMDNFGGGNLSEERKKMIADRMRSRLEKTYVLTFNQFESLYKEEGRADDNAPSWGRFGMAGNVTQGPEYKNIKASRLLQENDLFGKQFLIDDVLPEFEWKLESETKTIGEYLCFKATTVKKVPESMFGFGRRSREGNRSQENEGQEREITVTAWYTLQVPLRQGPGDYWGLPGLILEINEGRNTVYCSKLVLNTNEISEIEKPSKGKKVTKQEYDAIVKKKMTEMREMYRRDGGGDRRR
ncbi:GLPGLI family protein [Snuella sedimenti]|uniref:GLPGLI family protein n=1 Tax=Snuella sedimenti TaxID=2798802 RepID=A0A8J7IGS9_9FLAO|nr:GLPGLI family protein [Snuella sedimenti]MBJ6367953.1 GLPGLI family protein [Snuella sedimenti]